MSSSPKCIPCHITSFTSEWCEEAKVAQQS